MIGPLQIITRVELQETEGTRTLSLACGHRIVQSMSNVRSRKLPTRARCRQCPKDKVIPSLRLRIMDVLRKNRPVTLSDLWVMFNAFPGRQVDEETLKELVGLLIREGVVCEQLSLDGATVYRLPTIEPRPGEMLSREQAYEVLAKATYITVNIHTLLTGKTNGTRIDAKQARVWYDSLGHTGMHVVEPGRYVVLFTNELPRQYHRIDITTN